MRLVLTMTGLSAAAAALAGCVAPGSAFVPDLGHTVNQALAAQIADPDRRYAGVVQPGSSGIRTSGTQVKYEKATTPPPAPPATTLNISTGAGAQ